MVESIGEELRSFYNFLKYPQQNIFKENLNLKNVLPIISSYYVVFICGIIVLTPFAALAGLDSMPHKLQDLQEMNKWVLLLVAVITQPFLEELLFRFPLKYHRALIALILTMVGMIIYMVLSKFNPSQAEPDFLSINILIPLSFTLISILVIYLFYRNEDSLKRLSNFVKRYFPHFFYTVAVYFAFVHFFNFETTGNQWLFTPIMVFPQFLIALFVGYTRLRYGFLSAVIIHMINNLIPTLILLFVEPKTIVGIIGLLI